MKKLKFLSLALFLMLGLTVMGSGCTQKEDSQESTQNETTSNESIPEDVEEENITVLIDYGSEKNSYEVGYEEGMTAYDALKKVAEKDSLEIETTDYDFGKSIDGIGVKKGGVDERYWMYYVNDKTAQVAVDNREVSIGDEVEFKYELSNM